MDNINVFDEISKQVENVGATKLIKNKLGEIRRFAIVEAGTVFDSKTLALELANWKKLLKLMPKSKRMFVYPPILNFANISEDETNSGATLDEAAVGKDMILAFTCGVNVNKSLARKMRSHNGKNFDIFLFDESDSVLACSKDGEKIKGFSTQLFSVMGQGFAEADKNMITAIKVVLADSKEWNDYGVVIEPSAAVIPWSPLSKVDLDSGYDVNLVVTNPSATGFTLGVYIDSIAQTNERSWITGLETTPATSDIVVKLPNGNTWVPTSITDNEDGTYGVVGTALLTGSKVDLKPIDTISLDSMIIESTGSKTITFV